MKLTEASISAICTQPLNLAYVWKRLPLISTGGFWKSRRLSYLDSNTSIGKAFQVWMAVALDSASSHSCRARRQSPPSRKSSWHAMAPWSVFFNSVMFVSFQTNVHALLELTLPTTLSSKQSRHYYSHCTGEETYLERWNKSTHFTQSMTAKILTYCVFHPFSVICPSRFWMQSSEAWSETNVSLQPVQALWRFLIWAANITCFKVPRDFRGTFRTCVQTHSFHTWENWGSEVFSPHPRSQSQ